MVNIVEIVTPSFIYTVGAVPNGLTDAVEKITFFSTYDPYNKNRNFEGPCYIVYFLESPLRRIVPLKEVRDLGVEFIKEEVKKKTHPEAMEIKGAGE